MNQYQIVLFGGSKAKIENWDIGEYKEYMENKGIGGGALEWKDQKLGNICNSEGKRKTMDVWKVGTMENRETRICVKNISETYGN